MFFNIFVALFLAFSIESMSFYPCIFRLFLFILVYFCRKIWFFFCVWQKNKFSPPQLRHLFHSCSFDSFYILFFCFILLMLYGTLCTVYFLVGFLQGLYTMYSTLSLVLDIVFTFIPLFVVSFFCLCLPVRT